MAATVTLSPGANIQAYVNANPAGTTFALHSGVYRMQSIVPKKNDIFEGYGTAILKGSQVLTFVQNASESGIWMAAATALPADGGVCDTAHPVCYFDQDLFIDGVLQTQAASLRGLAAGSWYFDRTHGVVYLPVDPSGHVIELGMTRFAFSGDASGVKVVNLTVEQYANPGQTGAVGAYKDGTNWVVDNVRSCFNHGTGVSLGGGGQILNSSIHNNGQMGVAIAYGSNSIVSGNEIAWNNYAGYSTHWEAGGSKFWSTTNLQVRNNYVHDNGGPGLWTDYNNTGTVYRNNNVINNLGVGILHEISYNATILENTVSGNASSPNGVLSNAQILLENSSRVIIASNTVVVSAAGGDGIGLLNEERGSGPQGEWLSANNSIHNNKIIYRGAGGSTGLVDYLGGNTAAGNVFDYDQYVVDGGGATHWEWHKTMTWPQMQGAAQELHGHCCN